VSLTALSISHLLTRSQRPVSVCAPLQALSLAMSESFGENITPARAIRQILDSYPFSVGLFRELLQNSDDAKATRQVSRCIRTGR
jgi:hypothetical protein